MDAAERKTRRRDVIVGAFVLAGTLVVFLGIFKTSTLAFGGTTTYRARYHNVSTLKKGSHVKYHGLLVGRVTDLRVDPEVPHVIQVTLDVREGIPVTDETVARIAKADLLGDEFVDLRARGAEPGTASALAVEGRQLAEGDFITAGEPFDLGAALESAQQAIDVLHDVASTVQREAEHAFETLNDIALSASEILSEENRAQVETAIADLSRTVAMARQVLETSAPRIDETLMSVQEASASLNEAADGAAEMMVDVRPEIQVLTAQLRGAVNQAQGLITTVDGAVQSVDIQQVNDLVANLETTSRNLVEFTGDIKERPYLLLRREKPASKKEARQ